MLLLGVRVVRLKVAISSPKSSVADLMRLKNHMAVWQHYPLLEEVAWTG
jgi:hypothetical protein